MFQYHVCYKQLAVGIYGPAAPVTVASWDTPCSRTALVRAYSDYVIRGLNMQGMTHYASPEPSKVVVVTFMARRRKWYLPNSGISNFIEKCLSLLNSMKCFFMIHFILLPTFLLHPIIFVSQLFVSLDCLLFTIIISQIFNLIQFIFSWVFFCMIILYANHSI